MIHKVRYLDLQSYRFPVYKGKTCDSQSHILRLVVHKGKICDSQSHILRLVVHKGKICDSQNDKL